MPLIAKVKYCIDNCKAIQFNKVCIKFGIQITLLGLTYEADRIKIQMPALITAIAAPIDIQGVLLLNKNKPRKQMKSEEFSYIHVYK